MVLQESLWESRYCQGVLTLMINRQFLLNNRNCDFHIALYQPDIPQNTGNIARLCVAANTTLHLIRPLGFSLSEKRLKRAGLDYWGNLKLIIHDSFDDFLFINNGLRIFFCTTKSDNAYFSFKYQPHDCFVFGSETQGLPEKILENNKNFSINIPMSNNVRSLNLSDSASIILYESIRQVCFNDSA